MDRVEVPSRSETDFSTAMKFLAGGEVKKWTKDTTRL